MVSTIARTAGGACRRDPRIDRWESTKTPTSFHAAARIDWYRCCWPLVNTPDPSTRFSAVLVPRPAPGTSVSQSPPQAVARSANFSDLFNFVILIYIQSSLFHNFFVCAILRPARYSASWRSVEIVRVCHLYHLDTMLSFYIYFSCFNDDLSEILPFIT